MYLAHLFIHCLLESLPLEKESQTYCLYTISCVRPLHDIVLQTLNNNNMRDMDGYLTVPSTCLEVVSKIAHADLTPNCPRTEHLSKCSWLSKHPYHRDQSLFNCPAVRDWTRPPADPKNNLNSRDSLALTDNCSMIAQLQFPTQAKLHGPASSVTYPKSSSSIWLLAASQLSESWV